MAQSQRTSGGNGGNDGWFGPLDLLRSTLGSLFSAFETGANDAYEKRGEGATPEADAESTDARAAAPDGAETAERTSAPSIDFAAMDPESALYALLCRKGGKMKQSAMVTETEWSKSKVSRRLSNLEESGRIGRVRQGREKVVFVKPGGSETDAQTGIEVPA